MLLKYKKLHNTQFCEKKKSTPDYEQEEEKVEEDEQKRRKKWERKRNCNNLVSFFHNTKPDS